QPWSQTGIAWWWWRWKARMPHRRLPRELADLRGIHVPTEWRRRNSCASAPPSKANLTWLTWRAPRLWCPLPASLAGGAGARPDHPISGHRPGQNLAVQRSAVALCAIVGRPIAMDCPQNERLSVSISPIQQAKIQAQVLVPLADALQ